MSNKTVTEVSNMIPEWPGESLPPLTGTFRAGTLSCLVGPDPAVRNSYFESLAGLIEPAGGSVQIDGRDTTNLSPDAWRKLRLDASVVRGNAPLLSIHHALMNVMLPLLYHTAFSFLQASRKARSTLEYLEFEGNLLALPAFLSLAEQRVIALARALISRPRALYLADFFSGLVTHDRRLLYRLLDKVKEDYDVCIVVDAGDLSFNWSVADKVIFVSQQQVQSFDSWRELVSSEDPDIREFLWEENVTDNPEQYS